MVLATHVCTSAIVCLRNDITLLLDEALILIYVFVRKILLMVPKFLAQQYIGPVPFKE